MINEIENKCTQVKINKVLWKDNNKPLAKEIKKKECKNTKIKNGMKKETSLQILQPLKDKKRSNPRLQVAGQGRGLQRRVWKGITGVFVPTQRQIRSSTLPGLTHTKTGTAATGWFLSHNGSSHTDRPDSDKCCLILWVFTYPHPHPDLMPWLRDTCSCHCSPGSCVHPGQWGVPGQGLYCWQPVWWSVGEYSRQRNNHV